MKKMKDLIRWLEFVEGSTCHEREMAKKAGRLGESRELDAQFRMIQLVLKKARE